VSSVFHIEGLDWRDLALQSDTKFIGGPSGTRTLNTQIKSRSTQNAGLVDYFVAGLLQNHPDF